MSILNENDAFASNALKTFELALKQEVVSGKNKKEADFIEAYPLIEQYLANNVSQKAVLNTFNIAYGYTLHPPQFRKMLMEERNRRAMNGDEVTCATCGHPIAIAKKNKEEIIDMEVQ